MREKFEEYRIIFLVVLVAITGASGAFFKIGLRELSLDLFTFLRFSFALIAFIPYLLTQKSETVTNKKNLILISILGALNVFLFVWGIKYTTAISSTIIYSSVPLVIAVLSLIILKEKISPKKWLGILTGFIGVLIIAIAPTLGQAGVLSGNIFGNLILVVALVVFSLYSVLSKKYASEYSPITLTKYLIFTILFLQSIFILFYLEDLKILSEISVTSWLCVAYVGIVGTSIYYFLYQYVIKKTTAVIASMSSFVGPLAGVGLAALLIGERMTPVFILGGLFIFLGMGLVFHEQYKVSKPLP